MAKSKAYLSFILLSAFLLSSRVLADEVSESSPKNRHYYNDEGNVFQHPNLTSSQDLEGALVACPVFSTLWDMVIRPQQLKEKSKSTRSDAEGDELGPKTSYNNWKLIAKLVFEQLRFDEHSFDKKPKNYEDTSVMRQRNMVRPSKVDWRTSRAFQAKTFGMNGGETRYGGIPRMEDIGKSARSDNAHVDELGHKLGYDSGNSIAKLVADQLSIDKQRFDKKPKRYEDASLMRQHNMVRPSEVDERDLRASQAKTFWMNNDGKTRYGGIPRMEDVGEETRN